jgi:hypothetical protein
MRKKRVSRADGYGNARLRDTTDGRLERYAVDLGSSTLERSRIPDTEGHAALRQSLRAYVSWLRSFRWLLSPAKMIMMSDESIVILAMDVLGRMGDVLALKDVEEIASHGATSTVRDAANRVLPILRDRARRSEDAARLLRPAFAPDAETLLRPASGPTEADPAVLLRPANASETNQRCLTSNCETSSRRTASRR